MAASIDFIERRQENVFSSIVVQFFEMVPLRRMKWQSEGITSAELDVDNQRRVLYSTVRSELCKLYPPSPTYQRAFLKKLLTTLEEYSVEICDEIYEAYTDLLQLDDTDDETLCYKTYTIDTNVHVTLQESVNMISYGTTGLNTWQAAQHLAEWVLENKQLLNGRNVLELGSGLGLTGITVCTQCNMNRFTFSDCHSQVVNLLAMNIQRNIATGHTSLQGVVHAGSDISTLQTKQLTSGTTTCEQAVLKPQSAGLNRNENASENTKKSKLLQKKGNEIKDCDDTVVGMNKEYVTETVDTDNVLCDNKVTEVNTTGCEEMSDVTVKGETEHHKQVCVGKKDSLDVVLVGPSVDIQEGEDIETPCSEDTQLGDSALQHEHAIETSLGDDVGTDRRTDERLSPDYWEQIDGCDISVYREDPRVRLAVLDWENVEESMLQELGNTEVILAADVVYDKSIIPALVSVLKLFLSRPTCTDTQPCAYLASTIRNEDTRDQFLIKLSSEGLQYEQIEPPTTQIFHFDRSIPIEILKITHT